MKTSKLAVAVISLTLVAGSAFAQMGGGHHGPGGGTPTGTGSGTGNGSGTGMGDGFGNGMGNGPGGNGMMADERGMVVGTDGTVYLSRHLSTAADGQFDVMAVRPSGVIGWTYAATNLGPGSLELAGTNVVFVQHVQATTTGMAPTSKLTALSQASGAVIWQLDVDGNVMEVEASNGVLYLTVVKPIVDSTGQVTPGGGQGERNLVAVSADGKVLWTLKLN